MKNGRQVFEDISKGIDSVLLPAYKTFELTTHDGILERWWVGDGETLTITWKKVDPGA